MPRSSGISGSSNIGELNSAFDQMEANLNEKQAPAASSSQNASQQKASHAKGLSLSERAALAAVEKVQQNRDVVVSGSIDRKISQLELRREDIDQGIKQLMDLSNSYEQNYRETKIVEFQNTRLDIEIQIAYLEEGANTPELCVKTLKTKLRELQAKKATIDQEQKRLVKLASGQDPDSSVFNQLELNSLSLKGLESNIKRIERSISVLETQINNKRNVPA